MADLFFSWSDHVERLVRFSGHILIPTAHRRTAPIFQIERSRG
jgi:hypothetical protein